MSDDASFDYVQSGGKLRTLTCSYGIDGRKPRENAAMAPEQIKRITTAANNAIAGLKSVMVENARRIEALQDERERERGGSDFPLPEYYIPVNRTKGTVGGDD